MSYVSLDCYSLGCHFLGTVSFLSLCVTKLAFLLI